MENIMLQMGTKFFTSDGSRSIFSESQGVSSEGKKVNYAEEAVSFFTSFADPRYKNFSWSKFLANPTDEYKDFKTFANGDVSMVFGYSQDYQKVKDMLQTPETISPNNFRVAPFPQYQTPQNSASKEIIGKVRVLAVPNTTKHPELAWKFLKFAVKQENLRSYHKATGLPTSRLDLITEQQSEPHIGVFVKQAKFARPNLIPFTEEKYKTDLGTLIQEINDHKISVGRGLKILEMKWNAYLNDKLSRQQLLDSFQPVKKMTGVTQ